MHICGKVSLVESLETLYEQLLITINVVERSQIAFIRLNCFDRATERFKQ